ncbi:MAG: hypothetical protein HKN04_07670 [Rhodothermaceae bacterium]|nr:hypothetical protein [Rhodothermaceae bacterium]
MGSLLLLFAIALGPAVLAQPAIPTGTWTGTLTPQNHPDLHLPMTYTVEECAEGLAITLASAAGQAAEAREVRVTPDRIRFAFDEPEEDVPLTCDLRRDDDGAFAGRCMAANGTYATFTMEPPAQSTIGCTE